MITLTEAVATPPASPISGPCAHGLVEPGTACPECLWYLAGSLWKCDAPSNRRRQDLLAIMRQACRRMVPPDLRAQVDAEAERGNWYALRFVKQWKAKQKSEAQP